MESARYLTLIVAAFCGIGFTACGGGDSGGAAIPPSPPPGGPAVVQKGSRVLEIQVSTPADGDFVGGFREAQTVGMESASLSLDWNGVDIGTDPNTGAPIFADDPATDFLDAANRCYPNTDTKLSLMLRPITTLTRTVPAGFENTPWDDPAMIDRFERFIDHVIAKIPDLEITALAIGSEVDFHFTDPVTQDQYLTFYEAVGDYARAAYSQLYPDKPPLRISVEVTHNGLLNASTSAYYQDLNATSDVIGVSYYPMENGLVEDPSVVAQHFADMLALYPAKNLHFYQLGYPSGYYSTSAYPEFGAGSVTPSINSSDSLQADFVDAVFAAWDTHASRINLIGFTWMHDETEADVAAIVALPAFGGTTTPPPDLVEFLRTLGLRTDGAVDKPAWSRLRAQTTARGWTDSGMSLICN